MISRISTFVTFTPQRSVTSSSFVRQDLVHLIAFREHVVEGDVADDRAERRGREGLGSAREVPHLYHAHRRIHDLVEHDEVDGDRRVVLRDRVRSSGSPGRTRGGRLCTPLSTIGISDTGPGPSRPAGGRDGTRPVVRTRGTTRIAFARNRTTRTMTMTAPMKTGYVKSIRCSLLGPARRRRWARALGERLDGEHESVEPGHADASCLRGWSRSPIWPPLLGRHADDTLGVEPGADHHALLADDGLRTLGGREMPHRQSFRDDDSEEQRHEARRPGRSRTARHGRPRSHRKGTARRARATRRPAADHTPRPGTFSSMTKNTTEATRSAMPISRTGRSPNDAIEVRSRIVPIVPEKMCPGTISSSTISRSPSQKKMNARFGSNRSCRKPAPGDIDAPRSVHP